MDRILRFAAAAALGLAFAAPSAMADSHGGVTVGGWIEVIGGTTDNDKAGSVDGISRGLFSRIAVSYDDTLDNGLTVAGRAAFLLNQRGNGVNITENTAMQTSRMDASTNYAPDVLYISVGGGFGTVTVGAAAPASCSVLPRPIAFLNGVNGTHYTLFTGLEPINATFSEFGYCGTPEQISYMTPTVGGFKAMATYAPDHESNQGTSVKNANNNTAVPIRDSMGAIVRDTNGATTSTVVGQGRKNIENRIDLAASWSSSMGGMNFSLGVGHQQGQYQDGRGDLSSTSIAGTLGFGAVTLGAQWYDTEEGETKKHDGYTLAAKYDVGNLTLATTWSIAETDASLENTALVLGASYAMGGGLTTWLEYMSLEVDQSSTTMVNNMPRITKTSVSDDIILVGVTLGF